MGMDARQKVLPPGFQRLLLRYIRSSSSARRVRRAFPCTIFMYAHAKMAYVT